MYVVLNATQPIQALTQHFDNLIRAADINPHEAAGFARNLAGMVVPVRLCLIAAPHGEGHATRIPKPQIID